MLVVLGSLVLFIGLYFAIVFWREEEKLDNLTLYGNVDIRQAGLGFRVSGRVSQMLFEEGDEVKKGDLLATLDKAPYEADLAIAKAQFSQAEANYSKYKHGNRPQEIEEARANVREQQAAFDNAEITLNRQSQQVKVGASSQQAYDDALSQKIKTEALLKSAKEALSLLEEGFRVEDIDAAHGAMKMAQAQLESAQINLKDTEIFSPSDGIMMTRVLEPGAIIAPLSIVYTLSLHKPVWVRAYVSEPNLGRIKPGMEALIITDSQPDKPFKGQIGFISPQAEFTPKTVETTELRTDLVYRLRILVDDSTGDLRQGMPVTVHIKLSE